MAELSRKRQDEMKKIHREVVAGKHVEAKGVKQQSYQNDLKKQALLQEQIARNQERKNLVRMQEQLAQQKLKLLKEKKLKEFKSGYDQRIQEELAKMKRKEVELAGMERTEGELIKKLQNTQQVQKEAFTELEGAVKGSASPKKGVSEKLSKSDLQVKK